MSAANSACSASVRRPSSSRRRRVWKRCRLEASHMIWPPCCLRLYPRPHWWSRSGTVNGNPRSVLRDDAHLGFQCDDAGAGPADVAGLVLHGAGRLLSAALGRGFGGAAPGAGAGALVEADVVVELLTDDAGAVHRRRDRSHQVGTEVQE